MGPRQPGSRKGHCQGGPGCVPVADAHRLNARIPLFCRPMHCHAATLHWMIWRRTSTSPHPRPARSSAWG